MAWVSPISGPEKIDEVRRLCPRHVLHWNGLPAKQVLQREDKMHASEPKPIWPFQFMQMHHNAAEHMPSDVRQVCGLLSIMCVCVCQLIRSWKEAVQARCMREGLPAWWCVSATSHSRAINRTDGWCFFFTTLMEHDGKIIIGLNRAAKHRAFPLAVFWWSCCLLCGPLARASDGDWGLGIILL